jgi:hypothetical protein
VDVQVFLLYFLSESFLACTYMCKQYDLHMEPHYAVFTGDLIGSSKASPLKLEATMANLAGTAQFLTEFTGADTKFTRFRGDGWQMVLSSPESYLRAVALIFARLKADDQTLSTRFAVGVGAVDSFGTSDLRDAKGPAFEYSGRALDGLTRDRDLAITIGPDDPVAFLGRTENRPRMDGTIAWSDAAILSIFSFIVSRWTRAQAEAVAVTLEHDMEKQGTVAAKLGITRQALNLRLTGAGYGPILTAIKLTEQHSRLPSGSDE